jgi:hypothetical protein
VAGHAHANRRALVRRFGPRRLQERARRDEVRGMGLYGPARDETPATRRRSPDRAPSFGTAVSAAAEICARGVRVNDGLVSNASLILGIAGASADARVVLLTGVAGMCAGAFAMATGEYVSVRSQRELFEYRSGSSATSSRSTRKPKRRSSR